MSTLYIARAPMGAPRKKEPTCWEIFPNEKKKSLKRFNSLRYLKFPMTVGELSIRYFSSRILSKLQSVVNWPKKRRKTRALWPAEPWHKCNIRRSWKTRERKKMAESCCRSQSTVEEEKSDITTAFCKSRYRYDLRDTLRSDVGPV